MITIVLFNLLVILVSLIGVIIMKKHKKIISAKILIISGILCVVNFLILQTQVGNPDAGKAMFQMVVPIMVMLMMSLIGVFVLMRYRTKG